MVNRITMRDLSDHTLKIIDEEAERNRGHSELGRNDREGLAGPGGDVAIGR